MSETDDQPWPFRELSQARNELADLRARLASAEALLSEQSTKERK